MWSATTPAASALGTGHLKRRQSGTKGALYAQANLSVGVELLGPWLRYTF